MRGRRGCVVAGLLVALVAAAGCSGTDDGSSADSDDRTTTTAGGSTTATTAAVEVEQFDGSVDDFYRVPDPLPPAAPGTLIRTMPVEAPDGEVGLRIMYHSTDGDGDDRAVTGTVFYPASGAPDDGWPVLAWAHGTSGLVAQCAPSRSASSPPAFGVEGVRVATDYLGLGPEGEVHPYLSAAAEGHAVIDSVAAVRTLPDAHAGDRWVVAGVSQGGHAALVTNEQAAERLADVELLGAVALAPGSQLAETYGDELQAQLITTLVLYGIAAEDPAVDPADYLVPPVLAASSAILEGCMGEITASLAPVATTPEFFTTDPRTDPVGEAWLAENDPGQVASDTPLLLVHGGRDVLVLPARNAALLERLCGLGQVVDDVAVPEADHNSVVELAREPISAWIAARFAGEAATDDC